MSDLTTFRDHCRRMAKHTGAIAAMATEELRNTDGPFAFVLSARIDEAVAEQQLWTQLADEIDGWLVNGLDEEPDPADHTAPLWEIS